MRVVGTFAWGGWAGVQECGLSGVRLVWERPGLGWGPPLLACHPAWHKTASPMSSPERFTPAPHRVTIKNSRKILTKLRSKRSAGSKAPAATKTAQKKKVSNLAGASQFHKRKTKRRR